MDIKIQIITNWIESIAFGFAILTFAGSVITFILSYFIHRINRRTISFVVLVSLIMMIYLAMAMPSNLRAPGSAMKSDYLSAVRAIILANYPTALESLRTSQEWAKYVRDDKESEILLARPVYLGGIDSLISCLDGGSLPASDLQKCISNAEISAIGYMWTKEAQHIILNIYPSGDSYLAIETGNLSNISDILGEQFEGSGYSIDIKRGNSDTKEWAFCWKYQSDDWMSNIARVVALDQFFAQNESYKTGPRNEWEMVTYSATDYFAMNCQGRQINGYCNVDEVKPPWGNFRQIALDIVKTTLNAGTEITPEEYMQGLKEAEENSGVKILTGSDFSRFVVIGNQSLYTY